MTAAGRGGKSESAGGILVAVCRMDGKSCGEVNGRPKAGEGAELPAEGLN